MFEKFDKFILGLFNSRSKKLEEQRDFLIAIKDRKMTLDSAIEILNKLIADENGTVNILA